MFIIGLGNGMVLPNANAGAVSVNPKLAGAASGMGGFLQIGGGAFLAVIPAMMMSVENKAMPLYIIMFMSALGATVIATMMLKVATTNPKTQTA